MPRTHHRGAIPRNAPAPSRGLVWDGRMLERGEGPGWERRGVPFSDGSSDVSSETRHLDFVIVDSGKEVRAIQTDPDRVKTMVARRQEGS